MKRIAVGVALLAAVSCSDLPNPFPRSPAAVIPVFEGGGISSRGLIGTPLARNPTVRVLDYDARPLAGVAVTFAVSNGGGSVEVATAISDESGVASAGAWTLGNMAGTQELRASVAAIPNLFTMFSVQAIAIQKIAAGEAHSCATSVASSTYCWGMNAFGQVGGTTTADRLTAQEGGGFGLTALVAGGFHTCGLHSTNEVGCWGRNTSGQIGINSTVNQPFERAPNLNLRFTSIAAGTEHTCGVTTSSDAYCWGLNSKGQLGDSTTTTRLVPTLVKGGLKFTKIAAGGHHTCAIATSGLTYCWGENLDGGVGDGTTTDRVGPTLVDAGGVTFANLALGGLHSCGIAVPGTIHCWGLNTSGQLGDGTTTNRLTPTPVSSGETFRILAAGGNSTCATTAPDDRAYCWGSNVNGQLGDGTTSNRTTPVAVSGGLSFTSLAVGVVHACGVSSPGRAWCWGGNDNGRLGDGTTGQRTSPTAVRLQ